MITLLFVFIRSGGNMVLPKASMTSDRPIYDEFYDGYRLFIGDLTEQVISTDVSREFSKFGNLIDVWVARNPPGFGFVVFHNKVDCERCKRKLNGRAVFDRPLRIEFARPSIIRDDRRAPASYQAYIAKLRERGIEPKFVNRSRSRSPVRRYKEASHASLEHLSRRRDRDCRGGSQEYQYKTAAEQHHSSRSDLQRHGRHGHRDHVGESDSDSEHRSRLEDRYRADRHSHRHSNRHEETYHAPHPDPRLPNNRRRIEMENEEDQKSVQVKVLLPVPKHKAKKEPPVSPSASSDESESTESSLSESESDSDSDSE